MGGGPVPHAPAHRARTPGRPVRALLVTPQDVTKFTPRLSPRAEQYEGTRLVFRIGPRSSSGSAFPIESGSDFAIGINLGIFDILEGGTRRGAFPLNENHWSNALAWLLDPAASHGTAAEFLAALAALLGATAHVDAGWSVQRETSYEVNERRRLIDIQLDFADRVTWFIENQIDPGYQDHAQISDQASLLGVEGVLIVIGPSESDDLLSEMSKVIAADARVRYVPWREIGRLCAEMAERTQRGPLVDVLLRGLGEYRGRREADPFARLIKALVEERGRESFYSDDCAVAFRKRYPESWAHWEAERPKATFREQQHDQSSNQPQTA